MKYGIIQGRLTNSTNESLQCFPKRGWEKEFEIASEVGLDFLELFVEEVHNDENPIWSDQGREMLLKLKHKYSVNIHSICNDHIIQNNFTSNSELKYTKKVLVAASKLEAKLVVLPLFGKSNFEDYSNQLFKETISNIVKEAGKIDSNIKVCIESNSSPETLIPLLEENEELGLVFDTGNRAAAGFKTAEDLHKLLPWVEHIHIKDKNALNQNVLLGTGLVNFRDLFLGLDKENREFSLSFESLRGLNPANTASHNISYLNFLRENSNAVF